MSLKARLKGQRGCDLFWSAATQEFRILCLTRDFVGIKPLKQHQAAECEFEKRYAEDQAVQRQERNGAKEDKAERQLSPYKKGTLLQRRIDVSVKAR